MIVSVKPAGSVAALAALGQHESNNEATMITVGRRLPVRQLARTPTAEENFMLVSQHKNFKLEDAASGFDRGRSLTLGLCEAGLKSVKPVRQMYGSA